MIGAAGHVISANQRPKFTRKRTSVVGSCGTRGCRFVTSTLFVLPSDAKRGGAFGVMVGTVGLVTPAVAEGMLVGDTGLAGPGGGFDGTMGMRGAGCTLATRGGATSGILGAGDAILETSAVVGGPSPSCSDWTCTSAAAAECCSSILWWSCAVFKSLMSIIGPKPLRLDGEVNDAVVDDPQVRARILPLTGAVSGMNTVACR